MISFRPSVLALALAGTIGGLFLFWPRASDQPADRGATKSAPVRPLPPAGQTPDRPGAYSTSSPLAAADSPSRPTAAAPFDPSDFPLAARLNAPDSTITRDLDILQQLFDAWRSNLPREGNPVGENADITAALTGDNRLGFALLPKTHPAINARGELCDRWGTPFRFHQLSGEKMEVRSAGPDRKFATEDDAVWTPQ